MLQCDIDNEQTPVLKCSVMEIEHPNKERTIESQAALIQMLRAQVGPIPKPCTRTCSFGCLVDRKQQPDAGLQRRVKGEER